MTYFHQQGAIFRATNEGNIRISKELPLGTYSVMVDLKGFYFEPIPNFTIEGKIYGETTRNVDRVINTFADREGSTGTILKGEKGSGKTLFAKMLSEKLLSQGVITLVVNSPFSGEAFNNLIGSVTQPCVVLFDEFEKVYNQEEQQQLLTLLDGTSTSKKLFVVTCNDFYRVSEYMKNRPGRFFYSFNYDGLSSEFVREYCEDCLNDKSRIDSVVNYSRTFAKMNFDILKALVEEMNRYNESVADAVKYLNATPMDQRYKLNVVGVEPVDKSVGVVRHEVATNYGNHVNPFTENVMFRVWTDKKLVQNSKTLVEEEDDYYDFDDTPSDSVIAKIKEGVKKEFCMNMVFNPSNFVKMVNGQFYFRNDNFYAIFERKEEDRISLEKLIAV